MKRALTNIEVSMEARIIQIIPVSGNIRIEARYEDDDGDFTCPVVCMALIEYRDGSREVVCLDVDNAGEVDIAISDISYSWV